MVGNAFGWGGGLMVYLIAVHVTNVFEIGLEQGLFTGILRYQ